MKVVLQVFLVFMSFLFLLFLSLWISRLRLDYNSEGRFYDEQAGVVYDSSGMMAYGVMTFITLSLLLIGIAITFRKGGKRQ